MQDKKIWGRYYDGSDYYNVIMCTLLFLFSPLLVFTFCMSCSKYDCSVINFFDDLVSSGNMINIIPTPSFEGFYILFFWILFQSGLYYFLPGKISLGQPTPAGKILKYKTNGLSAWILTHTLFILLVLFGVIKGSIIYDNWMGLLFAANCYGYFLTFFSFIKAHNFPSHKKDCKFSGSFIYDLVMGIELNPRFGKLWDFKLFHNGRPGIIAWTMINLSFAIAQYNIHGYVSNSMILLNGLQLIYVLDFFSNESWYLKTIDISHDHFGFYLAWGDSVWLPFMYTLQAQYLVNNPVNFSFYGFMAVYCLGLLGYKIFRETNDQKSLVRKTQGDCDIWNKPAKYIKAEYEKMKGEKHTSYLLYSGYWGLSRHFNYLGDLILSLSMCLTCGFDHILPYFYFIFMTILLLHRIERDNTRCSEKYGHYWEKYCEKVRFKLIPFVY